MQQDFPRTPDAVEPKWLTAVLQNHGTLTSDQQVVAVQQASIGDIVGVVGEVARFELTYSPAEAGPASVVIKFAHRNPENRPSPTTPRCMNGKSFFSTRSPRRLKHH